MWFRELNFAIPAGFMNLWTIYLGGFISLVAWGMVLYGRWKGQSKTIPAALYLFTAAVCVDLIGLFTLDRVPHDITNKAMLGTSLGHAVRTAHLSVSFLLLILSMIFLSRHSGPGKVTLKAGSIVLIALDCLGFVAIILALPGMPFAD